MQTNHHQKRTAARIYTYFGCCCCWCFRHRRKLSNLFKYVNAVRFASPTMKKTEPTEKVTKEKNFITLCNVNIVLLVCPFLPGSSVLSFFLSLCHFFSLCVQCLFYTQHNLNAIFFVVKWKFSMFATEQELYAFTRIRCALPSIVFPSLWLIFFFVSSSYLINDDSEACDKIFVSYNEVTSKSKKNFVEWRMNEIHNFYAVTRYCLQYLTFSQRFIFIFKAKQRACHLFKEF